MRYLLAIYTDEATDAQMTAAEREAQMAAYYAFNAEMEKRGVLRGGEALEPRDTAVTVRVRDGNTLTTDGPFAETKELLGGYYMVECDNKAEALECAAKIPHAQVGAVEVRPIMEFE